MTIDGPAHSSDAECEVSGAVDPETGSCSLCGVTADGCGGCNGKRYHEPGCPESDDRGARPGATGTWNSERFAALQELAARANEAARLSRRAGAPVLSADSTREQLIAWLQWCDPNGCHTDELADKDGMDPHDQQSAWEAVRGML